jgi:hypothetical protein
MKIPTFASTGLVTSFIVVLACVFSGISVAGESVPSSGFIPPAVESKLKEVKLSDHRTAQRWISADMTRANYKAVMVDRVIFYPAPNPGPQVSSSALEDIADYLTDALRKQLGKKVTVSDTAGPGILRMQPAITAVVVKKEGLSAMDIIPVHLLFSAAKNASGHTDDDVAAMIEVRVTDSVSGNYRAAVKLGLKGNQLKGKTDQLTLNDLQKALNAGAADGAKAIQEALSR